MTRVENHSTFKSAAMQAKELAVRLRVPFAVKRVDEGWEVVRAEDWAEKDNSEPTFRGREVLPYQQVMDRLDDDYQVVYRDPPPPHSERCHLCKGVGNLDRGYMCSKCKGTGYLRVLNRPDPIDDLPF